MSTGSNSQPRQSLIERAAEVYDFGTALRHGPAAAVAMPIPATEPVEIEVEKIEAEEIEPVAFVADEVAPVASPLLPVRETDGLYHPLDWDSLNEDGFIDPERPPTSLSEEFRIIKRQMLAQAFAPDAKARDRLVLLNSAHPGDGKTWMSINLALSLSAESDMEVLLIDGDFGKPSICKQLGLPDGAGFMDVLADPTLDVADLVMRTDIPSLSVLPAGCQLNNDTEILASDRTRTVLNNLVEGHPRRIVLFDSPPALAASAASELARHVGMVMVVVRADRTSDAALRDAVQLLSACPNIQAVLNGVKFSSSGRLFGSYYKKRGG